MHARGRVPHPVRQHAAGRRHQPDAVLRQAELDRPSPSDHRGGGPTGPPPPAQEGTRRLMVRVHTTTRRTLPRRLGARPRCLLGTLMVLSAAPVAVPAPAAASSSWPAVDPGSVTVPAPGAGPGASVTVSKATGLVNQTVRGLLGRASGPARTPGWPTPATPWTSTPSDRCASTSAAAATRRAPATATARPDSAASRRPTDDPGAARGAAVHLPRPAERVRRDAGRPGQLAGQRDARRRHR